MSLLSLTQDACRLLSLPVPSVVATSTDTQIQLLFALANEEGQELARRCDWSLLTREWTFTASATTVQAGALPPDFDHFLAETMWDRTTRRKVIFPITPQTWQAIQALPQLNRVFLAARLRGTGASAPPVDQYIITPTPSAGDTVAYEYVTSDWAVTAAGTPQTGYVNDTDEALLDESLIKLGLRWRFRKSKGLDYAEDFKTYELQVTQSEARDGGSSNLNTTGGSNYWQYWPNIPIGNFPAS